jgi:hypothetical protein
LISKESSQSSSILQLADMKAVDSSSLPSKINDSKPEAKTSRELGTILHETEAEVKHQNFAKETQSLSKQSLNSQNLKSSNSMISIPIETKETKDRTPSLQNLNPWMIPQKFTQILMIPLNAMFDIQSLAMTETQRFGRNNTADHPHFTGFPTLVVSRNHAEFWMKKNKVKICNRTELISIFIDLYERYWQ